MCQALCKNVKPYKRALTSFRLNKHNFCAVAKRYWLRLYLYLSALLKNFLKGFWTQPHLGRNCNCILLQFAIAVKISSSQMFVEALKKIKSTVSPTGKLWNNNSRSPSVSLGEMERGYLQWWAKWRSRQKLYYVQWFNQWVSEKKSNFIERKHYSDSTRYNT